MYIKTQAARTSALSLTAFDLSLGVCPLARRVENVVLDHCQVAVVATFYHSFVQTWISPLAPQPESSRLPSEGCYQDAEEPRHS